MEHEIQAKVAIAAALIQSTTMPKLDWANLVSGTDPQPLDALRIAVDKIYNALNNPRK